MQHFAAAADVSLCVCGGGGLFAFHLLLLCSSTCSLLLSADRILGSTRDSSASSITGSTALSLARRVFTYWQTHTSPNLRTQAGHHLGLNVWMSRPTTLLRHLASPCAAVWPPEPWTQRAESESVTMLPAEEPNPGPTSGPDWVPGNPTPAKSLGSQWLLKTMEKKNKNNKETIQVQRWEVTKYKHSVAALK